MPIAASVFRLFVSSTFEDFGEERERLLSAVFARLKERCAAHGCRFEAVDLRWGVSEAAANSQDALAICLQEIDRCRAVTERPNFLCMLGDRYGSLPVPAVLCRTDLMRAIDASSREQAAFLTAWYREDANALDFPYRLRPFPGGLPSEARGQIEGRLIRILSPVLDLPSATEHEIRRAVFADAAPMPGRAVALLRRIEGFPASPGGIVRGAPARFVDTVDSRWNQTANQRLGRLKERLRQQLGQDDIVEVVAQWHGDRIGEEHFPAAAAALETRLWTIIKEEVERRAQRLEQEDELAHHRWERQGRAAMLCGRARERTELERYLRTDSPHPFVLFGPSGIGKSTLMAAIADRASQVAPRAVIACRFLGTTPAASSSRSVLASLVTELRDAVKAPTVHPATEPTGEAALLHEALALASSERPLVVLLDAIDQLSDADPAGPSWLPSELPQWVRFIVSVRSDGPPKRLLERLPDAGWCEVERLAVGDAGAALDEWLRDAERALRPEQRAALMRTFALDGTPLVLRLLFEESRRWSAHQQSPELPADPQLLIGLLFDRLAEPANHGTTLVATSVALLAAVRHGIADDEMIALLSDNPRVVQSYSDRHPRSPAFASLPPIAWARLRSDLDPYLSKRTIDGALVSVFAHERIAHAARGRFLAVRSEALRTHRALSDHFAGNDGDPEAVRRHDRRALAELAYHQIEAKLESGLRSTLANAEFLVAMVRALGPDRAEQDLEILERSGLVLDSAAHQFTRLVRRAIRLAQPALRRDPAQVVEQIGGRLMAHGLANHFFDLPADANARRLRPLTASLVQAGHLLIRTLRGHERPVMSIARAPGGHLVSASFDGSIRIWQFESGTERFPRPAIAGRALSAVAIAGDGRRLIVGDATRQGYLSIGDLLAPDRTFVEVPCRGRGIVALAAGTAIVAVVLKSGTLALVDIRSGSPEALYLPLGGARTVAVRTRDDAIAVGFADGTLSLSLGDELQLAKRKSVTGGSPLRCLTFSPDGSRLAAGDASGCVYVMRADWHTPDGRLLGQHRGRVNALNFSPDGTFLLSGHDDGALLKWYPDRSTGPAGCIDAHERPVTSLVVFESDSGSTVAATGSEDGTVRIWDIDADMGRMLQAPHRGGVHALAAIERSPPLALSAGADGTIRAWSARDGAAMGIWLESGEGITAIAAGKGSELFLTGHTDGSARLWRAPRGAAGVAVPLGAVGIGERITAVAFHSRMQRAVLAGVDAILRLWRTDRPDSVPWSLTSGHAAAVSCMAMTCDGRHVLTGSSDGDLRLTDLDSGRTQKLQDRCGQVTGLATSGMYAVSCGEDGSVAIWDLSCNSRPELVRTIREEAPLRGIDLSSDARYFATVSADGTVCVGDVTGKRSSALLYLDASLCSCAFIDPPCRLVVGDAAGRVHILRSGGTDDAGAW